MHGVNFSSKQKSFSCSIRLQRMKLGRRKEMITNNAQKLNDASLQVEELREGGHLIGAREKSILTSPLPLGDVLRALESGQSQFASAGSGRAVGSGLREWWCPEQSATHSPSQTQQLHEPGLPGQTERSERKQDKHPQCCYKMLLQVLCAHLFCREHEKNGQQPRYLG